MKKKIFILCLVTCVAVTGTATYQTTPTKQAVTQATITPEIRPVSALEDEDRANTPPTENKATVTATTASVGAQKPQQDTIPTATDTEPQISIDNTKDEYPKISESSKPTPQPKSDTMQTATKSAEPKNGDTRVVDGQQQGYLIGYGWVDYMGENESIFLEGMYENGNKVGSMGDINKTVGRMD